MRRCCIILFIEYFFLYRIEILKLDLHNQKDAIKVQLVN